MEKFNILLLLISTILVLYALVFITYFSLLLDVQVKTFLALISNKIKLGYFTCMIQRVQTSNSNSIL